MKNFTIREMQDSDIDECLDVIRTSFLTVAEDFGITELNCPTNAAFMKRERLVHEKETDTLMYVACLLGKIIGFVGIKDKTEDEFEIKRLVVLPQYRHFGYGKLLLDFAAEKVISLGGKKITLGIIEENIRLKRWYLNYGFESTGTKVFPHLPFTVGFMEINISG